MNKTYRLFIALKCSDSLKAIGARTIKNLQSFPGKVKWTNPEQLHLTLKFLGDTDISLIPALKKTLWATATHIQPFTLSLDKLGTFPPPPKERVIWMGFVDTENVLNNTIQHINHNLKPLGIPEDTKAFKAHATLGRIKNISNRIEADKLLNSISLPENVTQTFDTFYLIQSLLTTEGPQYTNLEKFTFQYEHKEN